MSEKPRHPDELTDQERVMIAQSVFEARAAFEAALDKAGASRELALARTRLEEAFLWAAAALTGLLKP